MIVLKLKSALHIVLNLKSVLHKISSNLYFGILEDSNQKQ